jgi:cytochrome c oxidase cbb3-type subunit 3
VLVDPSLQIHRGVSLALCLILAGCLREKREFRADPPVATAYSDLRLMPNGIGGAPPYVDTVLGEPFENNAYNLSEGKRLYSWFGCKSCHGDGNGGVGPPFLDGWWQYGPEMVSIAASIRDGRPKGMPAFANKLTDDQVWQLAGYLRSVGGYSFKAAAPGRDDDRQSRPAENRTPALDWPPKGPGAR